VALDPAVRNKWLTRVGYVFLAFFSFSYFVYLGFPFERVLPRVLAGMEKDSGVKIEAATVRAGWFLSLVATDVKVFTGTRRGGEEPQPTVRLDKVSISPKLFSLLTGKKAARIDALVLGGRIRGTVMTSKSASNVDLAFEALEIGKIPTLVNFGVNASGQVGGTVKLALDPEDGTKAVGKIDLQVKSPRIAESNLILVKIPETIFDKGGAAIIDIKDGKAELIDVGLHGEDLDLSVEGEILLKKRIASSQWSAKSVIRASDAWKSKVPGFDAIVGPGKQPDGSYRYRVAGVIGGFPRTIPDKSR
jgi:type II secretion system protein N